MTSLLFVYGTLKSRAAAHRLLRGARFVADGSTTGVLYDLGAYPGLTRRASNGKRVHGELYELPTQRVSQMLRDLDRYEGREFCRRRVFVTLPNGKRKTAWTYLLRSAPPATARRIVSGRYAQRRTA